jgi:hypothetical protein
MMHTKRYAFDLLAILTTSKIPKFTCPDLGLAGDATIFGCPFLYHG